MQDKKVVFMGTPQFSVPVLEKLIEYTNVIAVVTQPDKEVGRKKVLTKSPVKLLAEQHNILVLQPRRLRKEYQAIIDLQPDIIITCAYGQILPLELLDSPPYKTINVHASLLPKLRGGAPIHHAILAGENETGITIMKTDVGMDSGPIIAKKSLSITDKDTYDTLSAKLSKLGSELLIEVLPSIFAETCQYLPQKAEEVTFGYVIKREDEHLNFHTKAKDIYNHIRGLSSIPGAYAILDGKEWKIYASSIVPLDKEQKIEPGTIVKVSKEGIGVATSDDLIYLTDIKVEGKRRMAVKDYLNGVKKEELIGKKFS